MTQIIMPVRKSNNCTLK